MNLEQLKVAKQKLDKKYDEFLTKNSESENGRTKKIRENAERESNYIIESVEKIVLRNSELVELLTNATTGYGRGIALDEFSNPKYFKKDMRKILEKLSKKIQELEFLENN